MPYLREYAPGVAFSLTTAGGTRQKVTLAIRTRHASGRKKVRLRPDFSLFAPTERSRMSLRLRRVYIEDYSTSLSDR